MPNKILCKSEKATKIWWNHTDDLNLTILKGQVNSEWIYEVIVSLKIPTKKQRFLPYPLINFQGRISVIFGWDFGRSDDLINFALNLTDKLNVKSTEIFWQIVVAFSVYMKANIQKNDVPNNFVGTFCVEFKIKFTDHIACVFKFSTFWKAWASLVA